MRRPEVKQMVTCVIMYKRPWGDPNTTVDYAGLMLKRKGVSEGGLDIFERVGTLQLSLTGTNDQLLEDGWEMRTFLLE